MLSMTGFGHGERKIGGLTLAVEISSVNRKQLEIRLSLPTDLAAFEMTARKIIAEKISRGTVTVRLHLSAGDEAGDGGLAAVNTELLEYFAATALALRKKFKLPAELDAAGLLQLPGVITSPFNTVDREQLQKTAAAALQEALTRFLAMRQMEGDALRLELAARLTTLKELHRKISTHAAEINAAIRRKLATRLEEEKLLPDPNDERLLREILFYADRADVSEELTRLESHFDQFEHFLGHSGEPVGRSLDFLIQELFREITTLANKAGNVAISPLAIHFKSELEKIREQVQNIE